ncbi:MAG TPA: hypothetical protein VIV66_23195, partial [Pyrinomonadaceae bacterium]
LTLLIGDYVPINIRRSDIGVTHKLLLDDKRRSHAVQERFVCVSERVPSLPISAAEAASW